MKRTVSRSSWKKISLDRDFSIREMDRVGAALLKREVGTDNPQNIIFIVKLYGLKEIPLFYKIQV